MLDAGGVCDGEQGLRALELDGDASAFCEEFAVFDAAFDEAADVGLDGADFEGSSVGASEEHEALGEGREAAGLVEEVVESSAVGFGEALGFKEVFDGHPHDGDGGFELVGGVCGETDGEFVGGFEAVECAVEDFGEGAEFVLGDGDGDAALEFFGGDALGGVDDFLDGREGAAGDPDAACEAEEDDAGESDGGGPEDALHGGIVGSKWRGDDELHAGASVVAEAEVAPVQRKVGKPAFYGGDGVERVFVELGGAVGEVAFGVEHFDEAISHGVGEHLGGDGDTAVASPEGFAFELPERLAAFAVHALMDDVEHFRLKKKEHADECDGDSAASDEGTSEGDLCPEWPIAPPQPGQLHAAVATAASTDASCIM